VDKREISVIELERETALELPRRDTFAVAIGQGGLIGVGVAIDNVNVPITVNVHDVTICVQNVIAVNSRARC
jgi:hypothetical protein